MDVELTVYDEEEDCDKVIAEMEIKVITSPDYYDDDWLDTANYENADLGNALAALAYEEDDFVINNKKLHEEVCELMEYSYVYYIHRLRVDDNYRGLGIGSKLISSIMEIADKTLCEGSGVIVLLASPIEIDKREVEMFEKEEKRLFSFYEKNGFTKIDEQAFVKTFGF